MWGESSKKCENNCQCSGLITENFKINSGNNATKRKQETAFKTNYKLKMDPHSLDFSSSISPQATKRRILGEIGNYNATSPLINRLKNSPLEELRPNKTSPLLNRLKNSPMQDLKKQPTSQNKYSPNFKSPLNPNMNISPMISPLTSPLLNSPIIGSHSPLTSRLPRSAHKSSKISKMFEEQTRFKMENKENFVNESFVNENFVNESCVNKNFVNKGCVNESFVKFDLEEETRDCFGESLQTRERIENWSSAKLDFKDAIPSEPFDIRVPEKPQDLEDLESLQDLEAEFESETFDHCTKYEIISTDSPNVISQGRSTSRKICSRTFEFGAPLADCEQSTWFNRPATRMLNFDDEDFEFTSPAIKKTVSVKKSLKFNETPTKNPLRHERSDSSIGSMSVSPAKLRLFTSESTTSMESGFISEFDEPFLEIEESNSPKISNFSELLSGQIKDNIITDKNFHLKKVKRPVLARSLSFHPESKARVSLLSILESPSEEKRKRDGCEEEKSNKRRRPDCVSPLQRVARPVLQRAFSENNATIKSALARSALNADLIGDYSSAYALPLTSGEHEDLKSISCDTLAALLRGEYTSSIADYQVIDCRYPYEFEGGHIHTALNLYTTEQVQALVDTPRPSATNGRRVLIFHCEFSIERGPKLSRYLRSADRTKNKCIYPSLTYPELYLLHGGYRAFHREHPSLCTARAGYTPMHHPDHAVALRHHRSNTTRRSRTKL